MEIINKLAECRDFTDKIIALLPKDKLEIERDLQDSIIAKTKFAGDGRKRILICAIAEPAQIFVKSIKDKKAHFDIIGRTIKECLSDKEVFCSGESAGIIRSEVKDEKITSQTLEIWEENSVKIGDVCSLKHKINCKGDKLYGFGIEQIIPAKIAVSVAQNVTSSVNEMYFTVIKSEKAAKAVAERLCPDYIFVISVADETDNFKIGSGCGIVFKDGNALIKSDMRELLADSASRADVEFSPYTNKNSSLIEIFGISGDGPSVGAIYVPAAHLKSALPVVNLNDVYGAEKILIEALSVR